MGKRVSQLPRNAARAERRAARRRFVPLAVFGGLAAAVAAVLAFRGCAKPGGETAEPPLPEECQVDPGLPPLARGEVVVKPTAGAEARVRVEFAVTSEQRQYGLMCRRQLDADAGMLFVFPPPAVHQSFWMRNTLIPLDMIFIDSQRRVLGVVEWAEPRTRTSRAVAGESLYVLEVNGGWAHAHGVGEGAEIEILGLEPGPAP